jgi:hypothetical protein
MTRRHDTTSEQALHLDTPVMLTPDQIAEAAGAAAAVGVCFPPPIIFGGIWSPPDIMGPCSGIPIPM